MEKLAVKLQQKNSVYFTETKVTGPVLYTIILHSLKKVQL